MGMTTEMSRLRWQCRRGMLELDLLFERFIEQGYDLLSTEEKETFREVLNYADQDLFEYFFGNRAPQDKEVAHVIDRIRHTAAN